MRTADITGQSISADEASQLWMCCCRQKSKLSESCITTKFFRLQPEYMDTQRICVTVCNVPANLPGLLVASLSAYSRVEEMAQLRATTETIHGDYAFRLCLDKKGFQAIPDTLFFWDRQMMLIVEGRRLRCWNCKHFGHLTKICPQKAADTTQQPKEAGDSTTEATTETESTNTDTEWTQITRRTKRMEKTPRKLR